MISSPARCRIFLLAVFLGFAAESGAGEVAVAVAANFQQPMQQIAAAFAQETGHKAQLTSGATGRFYAQIRNGAPFEVLLAADSETPAKLEAEGLGVPGTRFTYAQGRLVLWSAKPGIVDAEAQVLKRASFTHLALANPKLAPYGAAALETLRGMGLAEALRGKFVQAENIAQAHQFVASGNALLGFVAYSQVFEDGRLLAGSAWVVPPNLHEPILQDAVLLAKGRDNAAAQALLKYLQTPAARAIISRFGYL